MSAPATIQSLRSNPASNLVPDPVIASAEPSAAAEPLLTLVLDNEDPSAYEEIFARISAVVKPADFSKRYGSAMSSLSSGRRFDCGG